MILHDSGAGDFITHSGTIREIRRLYPTAHITMIVSPNGYNLAECCPYVNEVLQNPYNWSSNILYCYKYYTDVARVLLNRRFDICFAFTRYECTPLLMYMSGARTRISHNISKGINGVNATGIPTEYFMNLATHFVPAFEYGSHVVDANFALLDHFLHAPVANRELEVWYTPTDMAIAQSVVRDVSRPLYALMMGSSAPKRHYPPEKFAELVKMILAEEPTATFINLGGGQDDLVSAQILRQYLGEETFNKHVINLVSKTSFRIDAAIMSLCDMYIGNDTGNKDIAAAVKCPVLMTGCFPRDLETGDADIVKLFSPYRVPSVSVQPEHALPECAIKEPYHQHGCRINKPHCITQITPETLFRGFHLLKEQIAKKATSPIYIC